jgi:uncharacterized coiled-coil protein SlyX
MSFPTGPPFDFNIDPNLVALADRQERCCALEAQVADQQKELAEALDVIDKQKNTIAQLRDVIARLQDGIEQEVDEEAPPTFIEWISSAMTETFATWT